MKETPYPLWFCIYRLLAWRLRIRPTQTNRWIPFYRRLWRDESCVRLSCSSVSRFLMIIEWENKWRGVTISRMGEQGHTAPIHTFNYPKLNYKHTNNNYCSIINARFHTYPLNHHEWTEGRTDKPLIKLRSAAKKRDRDEAWGGGKQNGHRW